MIVLLSAGCLTCCARYHRESEFGFKTRKTANVHFKVYLNEKEGYKNIEVIINGEVEKQIDDESLSKEGISGKQVKFITKCGRHLAISFNLEAAQLTLKHNGEDVERLPEVKKELMICRNKITKSSTSDQRYVTLILILCLPRLLIIWRVLFTESPSSTPSMTMCAMSYPSLTSRNASIWRSG